MDTTADLSANKNVCYLLRLMMSIDASRSSYRWFQRFTRDATGLDRTDLLMALVTMMGWTGECIRLIRKGSEDGYVRREMLGGNKGCLELWDEIHAKPSPKLIAKFYRMRDKCFAHWDTEIAERFLQRLHKESDEIAFVETGKDAKSLDSRFPWVCEAIEGDLLNVAPGDADRPEAVKEWGELLREIDKFIGGVTMLAQELGVAISKEQGLELRES